MKVSKKTPKEILSMLRHGVDTEHLHADVTWKQGFDFEPTVTVSMRVAEFQIREGEDAGETMETVLGAELRALADGIHALTHEIAIFAIDRDCYRHDVNPSLTGKSCYGEIYDRKASANTGAAR